MVTRLSLEVHIYFTGGTYTKSCLLPKFQPVQSAPRGLLGWDTVCYTTPQALFLLRASREREALQPLSLSFLAFSCRINLLSVVGTQPCQSPTHASTWEIAAPLAYFIFSDEMD